MVNGSCAALLEVRGLTVRFRHDTGMLPAVEDISFSIGRKETVVLAGESGSGKTVTALALCALLPANAVIESGSALMENTQLIGASASTLVRVRGKKIAYIFQEPTAYLNPVMTVAEQIIEVMRNDHPQTTPAQCRAEALQLLERVRIASPQRVLAQYPHQLSGGMNQRISLAIALACRPQLLIADEPTTALDVTTEHQILLLLKELQACLGFSMLFITHNLGIARRIAARICVMHRGRLVEENATEELFARPRHEHTRELVRAYERIGTL